MLTTILLIRHAVTDWNLAGRWQGHIDIPLNDTGREQANKLAARLESWPIEAIYSSDLQRAYETAAVIGVKLDLPVNTDSNLRERNGGIFQGLTGDQLIEQFGEEWQQMRKKGAAPPEGESTVDVGRRVKSSFERISVTHAGEMVALVSHGGALNILISYLIGLPLGRTAPIWLRGNTGLSVVEINDRGPRLTLLNDVSHLSSKFQTDETGFQKLVEAE